MCLSVGSAVTIIGRWLRWASVRTDTNQLEHGRALIGPLEATPNHETPPCSHDMEFTGASSDSVQAQFINEPTYAAAGATCLENVYLQLSYIKFCLKIFFAC